MEQEESKEMSEPSLLTPVERRVLGALVEKEMTTPDYYPLTLNALTNACNQKSNRNPVMQVEEPQVRQAIDALRNKKLAMMFHGADSRVPKFKHTLDSAYTLEPGEKAILCELLLRGPQTAGELRSRCERMIPFPDLAAVEQALGGLMEYPGEPMVAKLPRRPGQKEQRFADLLSDIPEDDSAAETASQKSFPTAPSAPPPPTAEIEALRRELARLREDFDSLKSDFHQFRNQF